MSNPLSFWERIRRKYLKQAPKYQTNFIKTSKGNGIKFGKELIVRIAGAELIMGHIIDPKNKRIYQLSYSNPNDKDKNVETNNFTMKTRLHPNAKAPDFYLPVGHYILINQWFDYDTGRNGTYKDNFWIDNILD